ncbi:MAG: inositol monophosphatase [Clostridia bacterium]|nr:inositol monophosphatase [Clostridia bacterium]
MIEFLKKIVTEATKLTNKSFEVHAKDDMGDLVTNLDLEVEKFLIKKLKESYPDYDIVSEEFNSKKHVTNNCFTIDPIDGTINFANGLPLWAIQVACVQNGETVASVISLPKFNELYWADKNGAYLNGKQIHVREIDIKNAIYTVEGSKHLEIMQNMRDFTYKDRRYGSVGVAFCFTAASRLHGAVFVSDNVWDYEPGLYLIKQAGGVTKSVNGFHAGAMNKEFLDMLEKATIASRE